LERFSLVSSDFLYYSAIVEEKKERKSRFLGRNCVNDENIGVFRRNARFPDTNLQ